MAEARAAPSPPPETEEISFSFFEMPPMRDSLPQCTNPHCFIHGGKQQQVPTPPPPQQQNQRPRLISHGEAEDIVIAGLPSTIRQQAKLALLTGFPLEVSSQIQIGALKKRLNNQSLLIDWLMSKLDGNNTPIPNNANKPLP